MPLTWYKPSEHGWSKYASGKHGYYKGRGAGTVSVRAGNPRWKSMRWSNVGSGNFKQSTGSKTFWFKIVTYLNSDNAGYVSNQPGISTNSVILASDWQDVSKNFLQYKVVKVVTRLIPQNLGTNGAQDLQGAQLGRILYKRGVACVWITIDSNEPYPLNVDEVINKPSTKIINPMREYRRSMNRPKGYPAWGTLADTGSPILNDEWESSFRLFSEGFTPSQAPGDQRFFIQVSMFKVVYRGRR